MCAHNFETYLPHLGVEKRVAVEEREKKKLSAICSFSFLRIPLHKNCFLALRKRCVYVGQMIDSPCRNSIFNMVNLQV
jgi:hypothetical protein